MILRGLQNSYTNSARNPVDKQTDTHWRLHNLLCGDNNYAHNTDYAGVHTPCIGLSLMSKVAKWPWAFFRPSYSKRFTNVILVPYRNSFVHSAPFLSKTAVVCWFFVCCFWNWTPIAQSRPTAFRDASFACVQIRTRTFQFKISLKWYSEPLHGKYRCPLPDQPQRATPAIGTSTH